MTKEKKEKITPNNQNLHIDSEAVRSLAELFKETDLSEIEYETEGCRIRVARHAAPMALSPAPVHIPHPPVPSSSSYTDPSQQLSSARQDSLDHHPGLIRSPMVGTAYLSPQPGAGPFVREGGNVKKGDTLMILEAMKVMNPIKSPKDGKVLKVFVHDATPVEFDDALIVIE